MNIPLNHLYNHLGSLVRDIVIYRFDPHGSKKLQDLSLSKDTLSWINEYQARPMVLIMNDQEPLDFEFYNPDYMRENLPCWINRHETRIQPYIESKSLIEYWAQSNLSFVGRVNYAWTLYDRYIIVHSEKRSPEVERYKQVDLEPAYWWSHAVIARDWYRYAEIDPCLQKFPTTYQFDFNIYNRAWAGTREYRLKFADMLIDAGLIPACQIKFNPVDNNINYKDHNFVNTKFKPVNDLTVLPPNEASSCSSADYSSIDYQQCWFDVVLETLYDDPRLHLTEKILRPIACGKPFILVGTQGSLSYLREYGFKTFDGIIDESYDLESDPVIRMRKITDAMRKIQNWTVEEKHQAQQQLQTITEYNRSRFFSEDFIQQVLKEFVDNVEAARSVCKQHRHGRALLTFRKLVRQVPHLKKIQREYQRSVSAELLRELRTLRTYHRRSTTGSQSGPGSLDSNSSTRDNKFS